MKPVFALVDCNNFYASCEKLFRPDLKDTPVVVLSNNDGCVIARSREAKALGIKMGVPVFQVRGLLQQHGVQVFSSNYALYADMSARVMTILEALAPRVEVYSIDEAFLDLTGVASAISLEAFGHQVRETVSRWVGITVGVGIAPTKTLAKLANHAAKRYPATGGVVDLTEKTRQRKLMGLLPVGEVWGIGRRLSAKLEALGVKTVLDLADANPKWLRQHFSVVVERTVRELNGEACLELEEVSPTKQEIVCSRSFGERVADIQVMREAVASYTARAAEKLRGEGQQAKAMTVFIRTGFFNPEEPKYSNAATAHFPVPTDDTRDFTHTAMGLLQRLWKDGYRYMKAGVMLSDFYAPGVFQPGLFDEVSRRPNSQALMQVVDAINHSGTGRVWFAGQGVKKSWAMKRDQLSPAYTTRWSDLVEVR